MDLLSSEGLEEAGLSNQQDCINHGDTAWVLVASILVLTMMPGLGFFEAGLLRSKNVLSTLTQIVAGSGILLSMWFMFGYSLVYGDTHGGFIGGFSHSFFLGLGDKCSAYAPTIPDLAFVIFQAMFAAITPLLLTGTFAERMPFRSFLVLIVAWEIVVYYPLAHWIWAHDGWLQKFGVIDFAGGIVIHTSAGASSIVIALAMGQRVGFHEVHGEFQPHNLPLTCVGAALLWMGWYGFNAGSAYSASYLSAYTVTATTMAAAFGGMTATILSMLDHPNEKASVLTMDVINGVIGGLAGVTPASGFIHPYAGAVIGILCSIGSWYGIILLKHKLHIDDALDVSSVHGITGVIGSLANGIFADHNINPLRGDDGWIRGQPSLLYKQLIGVLVAAAWAGLWTFIILKVMKRTIGIQLSVEEEELGLDFADHRQSIGYNLFSADSRPGSRMNSPLASPRGGPMQSPVFNLKR